jgi:Protein of unknown function (DUF3313)
MKPAALPILVCAAGLLAGACSGAPTAPESGFLSDYSKLVHVEGSTSRYIDESAGPFETLIIDPIEFRVPGDHLDAEQREELRSHADKAFQGVVTGAGYVLTEAPGQGVARVRVAITDVNKTAWWGQLHPVSNVAGAGAGGLSVEAEVVDTMTNRQAAAVVRSFGRGSWLQLPSFDRISDAKDAIDRWAEEATMRLTRFRERRTQQ